MSINQSSKNNDKIFFTIPSYFDASILSKVTELTNNINGSRRVLEVYGCLSQSILGHGRASLSVPQITTLAEVRGFRQQVHSKGLLFNYLMNAPLTPRNIQENGDALKQHICDVLDVVKPDVLTISSRVLMGIVREIDSKIRITISTIAGIKTPDDLKPYLDFDPNCVTPHHDLGRNLTLLKSLASFSDRYGIELQLLLNESCTHGCERRALHYSFLASGANDDVFQQDCNYQKYRSPINFLRSGWIRPEDVSMFASRFGIRRFKISGRDKPVNWLVEVVEAYLQGKYSGNLIRLLAITPPWTIYPWEEIQLCNSALEGFIPNMPNKREQQDKYYAKWYKGLLETKKFAILSKPSLRLSQNGCQWLSSHKKGDQT